MVGLVIVSHSKTLAQGVAELARGMGGPGIPLRAVGGLDLPDSPLGTDASLILQAIQAVYSEDGVVVLMDLGSAILSAELALDLLPDDQRSHIWLCEAPLVEGAVAAAVQARLGSPVEQVLAEARRALLPKIAQLSAEMPPTTEPPIASSTIPPDSQLELLLTVHNRLGLHARPAARFVLTAAGYPDTVITVQNLTTLSPAVSARSINSIATLGVRQGHTIRLCASGGQARAALNALRQLAEQNFGDDEARSPSLQPIVSPHTQPVASTGVLHSPLHGLPVSPGLVSAPARLLQAAVLPIPTTPAADPVAEWQTLLVALDQTRIQIESARQAVQQRYDSYTAAIFEAHLLFLSDPALLEPAKSAIFATRLNAAAAWDAAVKIVAAAYRQLPDEYLQARLADVESVGKQVLQNLLGILPGSLPGGKLPVPRLNQPGILVASNLSPADTALLDPQRVLGLCTAQSGPTSHSAILARSLGIPAVAGLGESILHIAEGTPLLLDGDAGLVWLDPAPELAAEYSTRLSAARLAAAEARSLSAAPALTRDDRRIAAAANIGSAADARLAIACGAESVGLFRTEFLFLNRSQAPDEDEQYAAYRQVAEILDSRLLVIRTLDAGGDKPLRYLDLGPETNPYLGFRAIRMCLSRPAFFKQQLRAILRLAVDFPVQVMFPLIAVIDEWRQACSLLAEARLELLQRGLVAPEHLATGMMVETPAAALCLDQFAPEVDFFSIGSNDLTQYTLAAERGDPHLAQLYDSMQPAVLQLIRQALDAAHRHGKPVSVCGEMAADPLAVALLVGLGVDELSMNPLALPRVKQLIRNLEYAALRPLAQSVLSLESAAAVRNAIQGQPITGL